MNQLYPLDSQGGTHNRHYARLRGAHMRRYGRQRCSGADVEASFYPTEHSQLAEGL